MIASKTVYKFANNILKRFETGYDSGTYYLYNVTDDVLWAGNYSCKLLLDLLDGEKNTGELKEEFKNIEVVRGGSVGIESINMMER